MILLPDGFDYYRGRRRYHIRRRGQLRTLCGADALGVYRSADDLLTCQICQRVLDRQRAFTEGRTAR